MTGRCPTCKGTGRKPLPRALVETVDVLDREWRPTGIVRSSLVAASIAFPKRASGRLVISVNAVANRLERLRALGLVESRTMKSSTVVEWRLVEEHG